MTTFYNSWNEYRVVYGTSTSDYYLTSSWNWPETLSTQSKKRVNSNENSVDRMNSIVYDIKTFFVGIFSSIGSDYAYYYLDDVPKDITKLLRKTFPNFNSNSDYSSELVEVVPTVKSTDKNVLLLNRLRDFNGYVVYNFLNQYDTLNKLAQALFMRINAMFYSDNNKKYVLFIEDGDKSEELLKIVKLSSMSNKNLINIRHFIGKYNGIDLDITLGMLILIRDKQQEVSLHEIITNNP